MKEKNTSWAIISQNLMANNWRKRLKAAIIMRDLPRDATSALREKISNQLIDLLVHDKNDTLRREVLITIDQLWQYFYTPLLPIALAEIFMRDKDPENRILAQKAFIKINEPINHEKSADFLFDANIMFLKFYKVLLSAPTITGDITETGEERYITDEVMLFFEDAEDNFIKLKYSGRIYNYSIMGPNTWSGQSTREQIAKAISQKGQKPKFVQYTIVDNYNSNRNDLPLLEFDYEIIEPLLKIDPENSSNVDCLTLNYRLLNGRAVILRPI